MYAAAAEQQASGDGASVNGEPTGEADEDEEVVDAEVVDGDKE